MRLARLGNAGNETPVAIDGDVTYDLSPITPDIDGAFLAAGGVDTVKAALDGGQLNPLEDAADLRFGPPLARPSAVLCIGQNYAAHAAESGSAPPEAPVLFFKHPNTVVGPYDDVRIPPGAATVDWEIELAVVIGATARYLASPDEAIACIAGYTVSNDVSERTYQMAESGGQWSKGKCCETFNPLGPYLVPAAEVINPQALRLWSSVNGEPRQDSTTADMIFSVAHLVWDLSQYLVLDPGDIINTGTPEGVALSGRFPYLVPGDTMEVGIDGLGQQRQRLVQAP